MIFSLLDIKDNKKLIYTEELEEISMFDPGLTRTFAYHPSLKGLDLEYASIYASGTDITALCPPHLLDKWLELQEERKIHEKTWETSKINLEETSYIDLLPEHFIHEYFGTKNKIIRHIFQTHSKPENHDFMRNVLELVDDLSQYEILVKKSSLLEKKDQHQFSMIWNAMEKGHDHILYNPFGTVTGRFTTKHNSFPILILKKEMRDIIHPHNDIFIELDFNCAEMRSLIYLLGEDQPAGDVYVSLSSVFPNLSRDEIKLKTLAWLYNPASQNDDLSGVYSKKNLFDDFWQGEYFVNPFGRKIECDEYHFLSYLNQSTSHDLFLEQVRKIRELLDNTRTQIAFLIHDSVVLDFSYQESFLLMDIIDTFSKTRFGKYKINVKKGRNFGEMQKNEVGNG